MSIELKPLKDKCNLSCSYCFARNVRSATISYKYDLDAMLKKVEEFGQICYFTVFGGEPLLVPFDDLEKIFSFGFEKFKQNSIQTNGVMITDAYIYLFKKYNVHVGFSLDGPGLLNSARCDEIRTARILRNVDSCLKASLTVSFIVTIHKNNIVPELIIWLSNLDDLGIKNVNIHFLENDNIDSLVPKQENLSIFLGWLYDAAKCFKTLKIDNFEEMRLRLFTGAGGCCAWNSCDPYTTKSVQGIGPFGEMHNCGRENKDGIDYIKADSPYPMREIILYDTPQMAGGCQGCRLWYACHGYCPGTGLNGDWRNRSEHCESLKLIFGWIEAEPIKVKVSE